MGRKYKLHKSFLLFPIFPHEIMGKRGEKKHNWLVYIIWNNSGFRI